MFKLLLKHWTTIENDLILMKNINFNLKSTYDEILIS